MKTFHQIVSNLHAITERFIVPLKYFFISLKSFQMIVFHRFTGLRGGGQI